MDSPERKEQKKRASQKYREVHHDEVNSRRRSNRAKNPSRLRAQARANTVRLRIETHDAYGNMCSCCGETDSAFLTVDHTYNDGAAHRKELSRGRRGGAHLYRWLKKNNFPKDRFQLLCFNCNCGKYRNRGVCPHENTEATPSVPAPTRKVPS